MPEIKNTFLQGKMNLDLDDRLIPNGQYREAMNVQVVTSEGSDVGTVTNIQGNTHVGLGLPTSCECVGSIADERTDKIYWFVRDRHGNHGDAILEYDRISDSSRYVIFDAYNKYDDLDEDWSGQNLSLIHI